MTLGVNAKVATGSSSAALRVVQSETRAVHQPTLIELMSLTDWTRFVPETLGLLIVIMLLRNAAGETSIGAGGMPHPLWIPVLLMSAQYGIMGGLFAVIAAGGAFLATDLTARSATQDFYEYAAVAAAQPCAWFAAALVLGGLRTLHIHNEAALKEQLDETKAAADDLAGSFEDAVGEIARLEYRIATDTATTATLLDSLAGVDLTSRAALLTSAPAFVRLATGFRVVRLYIHSSALPQVVPGSIRAPVRLAKGPEALAWVVCGDLQNPAEVALAERRLNEVCRVLGNLLSACTEIADAPPA